MFSTGSLYGNLEAVSYVDVSNFITDLSTGMSHMFDSISISTQSFEIIGLDTWDVLKVTDMSSMFNNTGARADT